MHVVKRSRCRVMPRALAKGVTKPSEASVGVTGCAVQALDVRGGCAVKIGCTKDHLFGDEWVTRGLVSDLIIPLGSPAYGVVFDGLGIVDAVAKGRADRRDVGRKPVTGQLRHEHKPCSQVGNESVSSHLITSPNTPRDDKATERIHANEDVSLADTWCIRFGDTTLLLAHERPDLIDLDQGRTQAVHKPVVEPLCSLSKLQEQLADGPLVDVSHALNCADAVAIDQSSKHTELLLTGQNVHGSCLSPAMGYALHCQGAARSHRAVFGAPFVVTSNERGFLLLPSYTQFGGEIDGKSACYDSDCHRRVSMKKGSLGSTLVLNVAVAANLMAIRAARDLNGNMAIACLKAATDAMDRIAQCGSAVRTQCDDVATEEQAQS